jgi:hypothetical protein
MLVADSATFSVASLDDAIKANMKICVDEPVAQIIFSQHPRFGKSGLDVVVPVWGAWRAVKAGKCDAVIADQDTFKTYAMDGRANIDDCAAEKAGTLSKEEAFCVRSLNTTTGEPTGLPVKNRDCGFGQVGDVLATIPIAWAASPYLPTEIFHGLSWAIREKLDQGAYLKAESIFQETTPSDCPDVASKAASASLPISALFGSAAASGCFVTIGILIALTQRLRQCKSDPTSSETFKRKEEPEDSGEQDSDDAQAGKFGAVNMDILGSQIVAHAKHIEALLKTHGRQMPAQLADPNSSPSSESPRQPADSDRLLGAFARRECERHNTISILGFRVPSPFGRRRRRWDDDNSFMVDLAHVPRKSRDMPNVVPKVLPEDTS